MNVATKLLIERLNAEVKRLQEENTALKATVAKLTPKPKPAPKVKAEE